MQSYCKSRCLAHSLRLLVLLLRADLFGDDRCLLLVVVGCLKGGWERVLSVIFNARGGAETMLVP